MTSEPKDYAQVWTEGGGVPTFDEIDGFLYRHFNARAVYVSDLGNWSGNTYYYRRPDGSLVELVEAVR